MSPKHDAEMRPLEGDDSRLQRLEKDGLPPGAGSCSRAQLGRALGVSAEAAGARARRPAQHVSTSSASSIEEPLACASSCQGEFRLTTISLRRERFS